MLPRLRCLNCNAVCRTVLDVKSALWSWPVTALVIGLCITMLKGTPQGVQFEKMQPFLYGSIGGAVIGLGFYGIRRGLKLVLLQPVGDTVGRPVPTGIAQRKKWIVNTVVFVVLFSIGLWVRNPLLYIGSIVVMVALSVLLLMGRI